MCSTDVFNLTDEDDELFIVTTSNKTNILEALEFAANYIRSNSQDSKVASLFDKLYDDVLYNRLTDVNGESLYDAMEASYK